MCVREREGESQDNIVCKCVFFAVSVLVYLHVLYVSKIIYVVLLCVCLRAVDRNQYITMTKEDF